MANNSGTKCPKCGHTYFELVEDSPAGARYKMYYIRCSSSSCKIFLQALPFRDTNHVIDSAEESIIKKIQEVDKNTTNNLVAISQNVINGFTQLISLIKGK